MAAPRGAPSKFRSEIIKIIIIDCIYRRHISFQLYVPSVTFLRLIRTRHSAEQ